MKDWIERRVMVLRALHADAERLWRADRENIEQRETMLMLGAKLQGLKEVRRYLETHS